jgi:diacylglycerol kinase
MNENEQPKRETLTDIDTSILGTAKIDPDRYATATNTTLWERIKYAVAGLLHLLVRHPPIRHIIMITLITYAAAWGLGVNITGFALLTVALGQLWLAEIFNTGLEAVTDLTTEGNIRSLAKVTKDVAAAGTFIASGVLLIVCTLVLLPPLLAYF